MVKVISNADGAQGGEVSRTAARRSQAVVPAPTSERRTDVVSMAACELADREQYASAIRGQWRAAANHFLVIGRYLVFAKGNLPHGEFEAMIRSDLPFDPSTARQFMQVARAVDGKVIAKEELPVSYRAAYDLVTLDKDSLDAARRQNLVRPDVTVTEVKRFKQARKGGSLPRPRLSASVYPQDIRGVSGDPTRDALIGKRRELVAERDRIDGEIQAIDRMLADMDGNVIEGTATRVPEDAAD